MAKHAESQLDEVVTGTGTFEQRTEQDEQKDETGGHTESDAEHAFSGNPLVVGQGREAHATVRQQAGHVRTGQAVAEKDQGDDRQRRAECTAGRFEQQGNADAGGDQIHGRQVAGTLGQLLVGEVEIAGTGSGDQPQCDVNQRNAVAWRTLERRVGEKGQEQRERQVDRPGLGVVEHTDAQHEGQRRSDPQLEQRPEQRQRCNQLGHGAFGDAPADVFGDQLFRGK